MTGALAAGMGVSSSSFLYEWAGCAPPITLEGQSLHLCLLQLNSTVLLVCWASRTGATNDTTGMTRTPPNSLDYYNSNGCPCCAMFFLPSPASSFSNFIARRSDELRSTRVAAN